MVLLEPTWASLDTLLGKCFLSSWEVQVSTSTVGQVSFGGTGGALGDGSAQQLGLGAPRSG